MLKTQANDAGGADDVRDVANLSESSSIYDNRFVSTNISVSVDKMYASSELMGAIAEEDN